MKLAASARLQATTPIFRLLQETYTKVGGDPKDPETITRMLKVASRSPNYKAMFPFEIAFVNAAKGFLRNLQAQQEVKGTFPFANAY